ncbi:MAG TPA: hypothetical protein VGC41_27060, partial [Kofleriaceae bacterium]
VLKDMDGETPAQTDDWIVTNVAGAAKSLTPSQGAAVAESIDDIDTGAVASPPSEEASEEIEIDVELDEGTPADGNQASPLASSDNVFVAGEIDVPTPPPEKRTTDVQASVQASAETPEFVAASTLLGNAEDPDTGSRTPALERRNP